jgi:hypothetical protein
VRARRPVADFTTLSRIQRLAAGLLKGLRVAVDAPSSVNLRAMKGSPMDSIATCAYAFVREQFDTVIALVELFRLERDRRRSIDSVQFVSMERSERRV